MSWQRIQGHDALIASFRRVLERRRLAHAYLFCGPEGVGKRLFATELAKALLCEAPSSDQALAACDVCDACRLVDAGTHPDYFAVRRPEDVNELPIEVMRELCRGFSLTSARGKGKVAVLDDADDLNDASANCFLKTLEEPPPRSVFILVGSDPQRQLPTIQSRCQIVRFSPLPENVVATLARDQVAADERLLRRAVRAAHGSPGQALALAVPALWQCHDLLLETLARQNPDTVALAKKFSEFVEDAGKETVLQRQRASLVLRLVLASLTDALTLRLGGSLRLEEPEHLARLRGLAERADPEKISQLIERCLETEMHINRYVPLALVLEALTDALGQILEGSATPK